jgi:hypothetical protein
MEPVSAAISAQVSALVDEALLGRLAICAGAGMSVSAGLPDGSELALLIHQEFAGFLSGYACTQPEDIVEVATAVASIDGGLDALQSRIPALAPFLIAPPTLAHKLLALLFVEGAIRLLTTNWDDCLERGWTEEQISVAANGTDADQFRVTHMLKIHGCCKRPQTLLITQEQLETAPFWAQIAVTAELATSSMVFVGIGDVAPYTKKPIMDLARHVPGARIRVVSPGIVTKWGVSVWKDIVPDLDPDRRLPMTADDFAEELARGWVHPLLRQLRAFKSESWAQSCVQAFEALSALEAIQWLRRAAHGWDIGKSVVRSDEALAGLKAVAIHGKLQASRQAQEPVFTIQFKQRSAVILGDELLEVLLARPHQTATAIVRTARERALNSAVDHGSTVVTVLCAATWVQGRRPSTLDTQDVFSGDSEPGDVVVGPMQPTTTLLWADDLIGAA